MGLFSSSKEKSEQKDAVDIKQATISDSQMNSVQNKTSPQPNANPAQSQQNASQMQTSQEQTFVNPFAQQKMRTDDNAQNPFANSTNQVSAGQGAEFNAAMGQYPGNESQNQQAPSAPNQEQINLSPISGQQSSPIDFDKVQEMIDETVEKVIEEKWNILEDKVNKVLRWKEGKDSEINMLKEDLVALGEGFNKLEMKLINKISNYDKNILDVNSEIKALEKVFQKVTPTLINNVNELSKIADEFKGVKSKDRKVMSEDDFAVEDIKEEDSKKPKN